MTVLLVIHVMIVLALIAVILLQRSSAEGFTSSGGGGGDGFMSGRASANALTRTTAILATLFIVNSMVLAYMSASTERDVSIVGDSDVVIEEEAPEPEVPAASESAPAPEVPVGQ